MGVFFVVIVSLVVAYGVSIFIEKVNGFFSFYFNYW